MKNLIEKTWMMMAGLWSFCVFCVQAPWILRELLHFVYCMREELQQVGELVSEHEQELETKAKNYLSILTAHKKTLCEHTEALDEIKRQQVQMSTVLERCAQNVADDDLLATIDKLEAGVAKIRGELTEVQGYAASIYSVDQVKKQMATDLEKLHRLDAELGEKNEQLEMELDTIRELINDGSVDMDDSTPCIHRWLELVTQDVGKLQEAHFSAAKSGAHLSE